MRWPSFFVLPAGNYRARQLQAPERTAAAVIRAREQHLRAGVVSRSRRWLAVDQLDGKDSAVLYNVGCLYAILGRTADAQRCLKKAVRSGWHKEWIKNDPDWNSLRGLREFAALVS
jgi:hypothetical protein